MIVKICKKHGELTIQNAIKRPMKTKLSYKCRLCKNENSIVWKKNNKDKVLLSHRQYNELFSKRNNLRRYNISVKQYNKLLNVQNNVCAICFEPEIYTSGQSKKIKDLGVDHCHVTGKIRGLLCHKCNRALGLFNDSIKKLTSAIQYLKKNG